MHGPTAARISARRAPSPSMLAMVDSSTPPMAPRQPAWAAATTPATGSANSTGVQSAASTPTAMPLDAVTRASARGRSASGQASVTATAVEGRVNTLRNTTVAREERMPDTGQTVQTWCNDRREHGAFLSEGHRRRKGARSHRQHLEQLAHAGGGHQALHARFNLGRLG